MLDQQLFELPASAARLEPHLQERIFTFESHDKLHGAIAAHRGIPYELALFAGLFLKNFGASLVTHPIDLFQSFFHGSRLDNHDTEHHECHHHCRPESHFFHCPCLPPITGADQKNPCGPTQQQCCCP